MPRYSAEDLDQEVHSRLLVVRVTDETSLSPRCRNDDFVATSSEFDPHPDNEDWSLYYQGKFLNWTSLTRRDVDSVVEHVTGGWNYWGFGKSSPWISTSADLDWSIWEIARRLVRLDRDEVELSVIRRKHAKNYRGLKSVRIDTFDVLRLHEKDNYYHSDLDDAMNFARASDEVLFCGRIFGKDVLETTTWTYYDTGFSLPEEYLIPRKHRRGVSWTNWLVWEAGDDSYYTALDKISDRREQIRNSRR